MHDWKILLALIIPGAAVALSRVLDGGQKITFRLLAARTILGSATSSVAGVLLIKFPDIPTWALFSAASACGILGQQGIEAILQRLIGGGR